MHRSLQHKRQTHAFLPGLAANIIGMLTVFATKYLCIGGPVIPISYLIIMVVRREKEAALLASFLSLLSVLAHGKAILGIRNGSTEKTDVLKFSVSLIGI